MRFNVLLIILLTTVNVTTAQSWCEMGARWSYDYIYFNQRGYVECAYEKDTTIDAQNCSKITVWNVIGHYGAPPSLMYVDSFYGNPYYTFSRSDTVFFWQDSIFVPVYYWGAAVGDTLIVKQSTPCHLNDEDIITVVDTVGFMQVNNQSLRFYRAKTVGAESSPFFQPSSIRVIEKIGSTNFLLPFYHCITDPAYTGLMCYEDDSLGQYLRAAVCKYLFTGLNEPSQKSELLIYPNPNNGKIYIELKAEIADAYSIHDLSDRVVLSGAIESSSQEINTTALSKGMYFIQLTQAGKNVGFGMTLKD